LDKQGLIYDDGFSIADGDVRYFNEQGFLTSKSAIQLIKLHGSLNWYRFSSYDSGKQKINYAKSLNDDRWHCRNSEGELLANLDGIPRFLTGTKNKLLDYTIDFYRSLQNKFSEVLYQANIILISGYGWNDIGVNKLLFNWIDSKTENKIILLHRNPTELKENSKSALTYRFDRLVESEKLVPIEKWLCDLNLKELLNINPKIFTS